MKKYLFFAAALFCVAAANARTWRVNYSGNTSADFKTIAEALKYKDFKDGDIIYVEPGFHEGSVEDNTITRPCVVVGSGWGFRQDAGNDLDVSSSCFTKDIEIRSSDVIIKSICSKASIEINSYCSCKNVLIERNKLEGHIYAYGYSVSIKNNYFGDLRMNASYSSVIGNIITGSIIYRYNGTDVINQAIFDHNTVYSCVYSWGTPTYILGGIDDENCSLTNNIFIDPCDLDKIYQNFSATSPFYNNVFSITPESVKKAEDEGNTIYSMLAEQGNIFIGATAENTFVMKKEGTVCDPAMLYRVKDDSPAKTAAADGGECGAFGGSTPYVLCGRPQDVPYLYDVDVPNHPTNNELKVTFKVAGQNE